MILHGVDMERYHPAKDRAQAWAEGKLPGRFGIGILGRVRAQKGTDLFVEAMCRLLPKYPDFTAVIIGAVTADQKMFTANLKKRAAEAGLSDRIVFLGELDSEEVPVWLRRMTIVACAQRWEGFGLVPVEAMASGAAVVATRVGAAHRIVVENDTGFLVPPDDLDTLTSQIEKLMQDPELAAKYGRQGRIHASLHFSIEREAAEIQRQVIRKLLGAASPFSPFLRCNRRFNRFFSGKVLTEQNCHTLDSTAFCVLRINQPLLGVVFYALPQVRMSGGPRD